jgi:hypothetical protein
MDELIGSVVGTIGALVVTAVVAVVGSLYARLTGAKLSEANEKRVRDAAALAVSYAEEMARRQAQKLTEPALSGAEKLELATERLLDKVPGISPDEAMTVIESVLPHVRVALKEGASSLGKAIRTPGSPELSAVSETMLNR